MTNPCDCKEHSFYSISDESPPPDKICYGCGKPIKTSRYDCRNCNGNFHKSCTELPNQINHACHPPHPLDLILRPPYTSGAYLCNICRQSFNSFTFHCKTCQFDLDMDCAIQKPSIKYEDNNHLFFLFDNLKSNNLCAECDGESNGAVFSCVRDCAHLLHLHCAPMNFPATIKNEVHWHQLDLTNYEDGDEDWGEYHCHVCEKRRNPKHPVYQCHECGFVAHMACALSEVLPSLVANYEMEAKASPTNAKLKLLEKQITKLCKAEKSSKSELETFKSNSGALATKLVKQIKNLEEQILRITRSTMIQRKF